MNWTSRASLLVVISFLLRAKSKSLPPTGEPTDAEASLEAGHRRNFSSFEDALLKPRRGETESEYELKPLNESLALPGRNISKLLDDVFKRYDKRIRPYYGIKAVDIQLDMLILSFGELSETNMEFTVDMYLGQFWKEPRLAFGIKREIILSGVASEKLWVPDTFFVNSIDTKVHALLFSNKKVWINLTDGSVMLSARLTTRNSCKVDLRNYPMDEQTCHLPFESFSYEQKDLNYTWRSKVGSDIAIYDKEMAQFDIIAAKRFLKHPVYHSPMFSGLTATMSFRRRSLYYIFQMYIPCTCVVILSWIAFWIDPKEGSERVGLGISAVLTISYMRGSMNAGMPRVSYLKSIDYFLLISFVFVFMSLIEYVLVLKDARKERRKKITLPGILPGTQMASIPDEPLVVTVTAGDKTYRFQEPNDQEFCHANNNVDAAPSPERRRSITYKPRSTAMQLNNATGRRRPQRRELRRKSSIARFITKTAKSVRPEKGVHPLDKYSRLVFPISYAIFLIIYFSVQYHAVWK
ncbi:gamma-aminobutyric acid receptor subunit beta-1 isoform X2 [Nematostella vectensis]|uniref:gamma-aminobutyric acid receptor subunit beta-1 isoform X2 n=1 Tax=Nematostella vectensis TaxID=45351 RepID=UPI00207789BC|nr:gamma-aminobutyric acid receptor subunit beta-1 isoform X2 [Nematostella vectensis]